MAFEVFKKTQRNRVKDSIPSLAISKHGVTFTKSAVQQWLRGRKFAEILIDKEANKIAFRFLEQRTLHSFALSVTGSKGYSLKITSKGLLPFLELKEATRFIGTYDEGTGTLEVELPDRAERGETR